jgi:hypothetical protein
MEFFNVMFLYVAGVFGSYRIGPNFEIPTVQHFRLLIGILDAGRRIITK